MESIVFHMEYRWNEITKMAGISPKTYSIWNGWNPPGMIWIPHGFHVECGGRVKTSLYSLTETAEKNYKYTHDSKVDQAPCPRLDLKS